MITCSCFHPMGCEAGRAKSNGRTGSFEKFADARSALFVETSDMTKMISILAAFLFAAAFVWSAHRQDSPAIPAGIEKLHKDDIRATVARDPDALTALLDEDAVLLQPGAPPILGKKAFHDFMKKAVAKSPSVKAVKYVPDIRDIQVAGNVAYEWGYFEAVQKSSDEEAPESLRAKFIRVMKRQPDDSWKFTRVIWFAD